MPNDIRQFAHLLFNHMDLQLQVPQLPYYKPRYDQIPVDPSVYLAVDDQAIYTTWSVIRSALRPDGIDL